MKPLLLLTLLPAIAAAEVAPDSSPTPPVPPTSAAPPQSQSPTPASQREPIKRHVGVQFDAGASTFIGDLTDEAHAPTFDFQLKFLYVQSPKRPLYAYLSVNALWTHVVYTGDQFIHDAGSTVHILSFLYVATLCGNPHYGRLHYCFGLGEGTVNTNSLGNRQDLGTWNYHGQLQYDFSPRASVMLSARFIGRLEQQVDFVDADFSFASLMLGPQYVF